MFLWTNLFYSSFLGYSFVDLFVVYTIYFALKQKTRTWKIKYLINIKWIHFLQYSTCTRATRGSKRRNLYGCVRKIRVKSRFERVKNVMILDVSSWASAPQSSGSQKSCSSGTDILPMEWSSLQCAWHSGS